MVTDRNSFLSGSVIRGKEALLTDTFVKKLGYSFALWLAERLRCTPDRMTIAIGRDARKSGERLQNAFVAGLTAADCDVLDCGIATTPAMQMSVEMPEIPACGAVMITASAAAEDINGFKLFSPDGALTSSDAASVLERTRDIVVPTRLVREFALKDAYTKHLRKAVFEFMGDEVALPLLGLHCVVDASNGAAGFFAELLESLGANTRGSFNLEPTGIASHVPTPESDEALTELSRVVKTEGADLGVMFDPDGDRVAIVDASGRAINRNRLIALLSAILLDDEKNLTFVTDSVTSSGLSRFITEWGGNHYRYRRGYKNVIDEAKRLSDEGFNVQAAIETSGHAALKENYFIDDGMYLATKVICEAMWRKRDGLTLSSLIEELQEPCESIEVRLPIVQDDYRKAAGYVIEAILSKTLTNPEWRLASDNREGVRILFSLKGGVDNAWFMLRLSVHDPVMVINAESEVSGGLKYVLCQLYAELARDNEELDLSLLRAKIDQLN